MSETCPKGGTSDMELAPTLGCLHGESTRERRDRTMADTILMRPAKLTLFDGGAGASAPAGGEGTGAAGQGETTAKTPGSTRRGKTGEYDNVRFGKQDVQTPLEEMEKTGGAAKGSDAGSPAKEAQVQTTSSTLEDKRKAFRELVNGEYKDQYTEETQRLINRRFKESKAMEESLNAQKPVIDMLMQRYKIEDGDVGKLAKAIENDNAYWSEAAAEAGMSVDVYKQVQKIQRENEMLRRAERNRAGEAVVQRQLRQWAEQAEAMKALYPNFDMAQETANPAFVNMLKAGIPVEHANKVLHMDEIVSGAVTAAAKQTEQQVVANIRAKGARPAENGTSSQSAFTIKDDVSKLSKKDRAEIARRAAMGEKISF